MTETDDTGDAADADEASEYLTEAEIAEGGPVDCGLLAARMETGVDAILVVLLDRAGRRLVELDWKPGTGFVFRSTDIAGDVPRGIGNASVAGRMLVAHDAEGSVRTLDRETGEIGSIPNLPSPVVVMPRGDKLIAATDRGLLTIGLWNRDGKKPWFAAGIEPLLVKDIDNPGGMILLPGTDPGHFILAIGCYGAIELITVADRAGPNDGYEVITSQTVPARGLAHDPVIVAHPPFAVPALTGPWVYAQDDGGTGLIALDVRTTSIVPYPHGSAGYGSVRRACASVDSDACLVVGRDGRAFHWRPGHEPRQVGLDGGLPLLWQGDRGLVMDRDRPILRDTILPW
ncbi:MAG: hypothetical protein KDJ88_13510 [Bauldia sp.]|nr:hypothetical protein [Bauldia sp.]